VDPDQVAIQLISFGYKFGVPLECDLLFDVRFLQNPYYVPELRRLSGLTDSVRAYVLDQPLARRFLAAVEELLDLTLPAYLAEGKTRLTIGICSMRCGIWFGRVRSRTTRSRRSERCAGGAPQENGDRGRDGCSWGRRRPPDDGRWWSEPGPPARVARPVGERRPPQRNGSTH